MPGWSALDPFLVQPILVERPWGGDRLAARGAGLPPETKIGESWEIVDLPQHVARAVDEPSSIIATGPFAGERLHHVVSRAGDALLGSIAPTADGRFPLLFKLLDARQHLSVQVHPRADYVSRHPDTRLKTESWYVIDAGDDSVLYLDVADHADSEAIERALGSGQIVDLLRRVPARVGDFHHVPAGLVHALGAGTFVAEAQTPSDTTFRIYDWSVEYGRVPRPLHVHEAAESIRVRPDDSFSLPGSNENGRRVLTSNEHYWMCEHRVRFGSARLSDRPGPRVLHVVDGSMRLGELDVPNGTTAIVPATSSSTRFETAEGGSVLLEVGITP